MNCPTCGRTLRYVADYGAPGIGQAWECEQGHKWAKVGADLYDPSEGEHLQEPGDVA